jgi:pimeloyl-ACP methyl ester carboxylesterase
MMTDIISRPRRRFFNLAAVTLAAAQFGTAALGAPKTRSGDLPVIRRGANTSFGALKQVNAGPLDIGYAEAGPADGPVVILLHGWPYDIHSFLDVAPLLTSQGYRVIIPHLRGHGTTTFLSHDTARNGQQSAVASDIIALMDALKIQTAIVAGFDWGARTACIIAALWPERCKALVSVSGYLIGSVEAGRMPLPPKAEYSWWYQFYFATERGRQGYEKYRRDFARLIWENASPKWHFDDATFERSAASLEIPITLPSSFTTTVGGRGWPMASRNTTTSRRDWQSARPYRCRRSPSKATPMAHRIPSPPPIAPNSLANTNTAPSPAASATTCRRKHRERLRRRSSTWENETGCVGA